MGGLYAGRVASRSASPVRYYAQGLALPFHHLYFACPLCAHVHKYGVSRLDRISFQIPIPSLIIGLSVLCKSILCCSCLRHASENIRYCRRRRKCRVPPHILGELGYPCKLSNTPSATAWGSGYLGSSYAIESSTIAIHERIGPNDSKSFSPQESPPRCTHFCRLTMIHHIF